MKFKKYTHTAYTLSGEAGGEKFEVAVDHEAVDWIDPLVERIGDTLVVAYAVQDSDARCPMEAGTASGVIITQHAGMTTDNGLALSRALYVDDCHSASLTINGITMYLREHAATIYLADQGEMVSDEDYDDRFSALVEYKSDVDEVDKICDSLYRDHWKEIVGPYVVPISVMNERGGVRMWTEDWDGDINHLPDGVWIADKDAEDNINCILAEGVKIAWEGSLGGDQPLEAVVTKDGVEIRRFLKWRDAVTLAHTFGKPSDAELRKRATEYAEATVKEYASWAEGDTYGLVRQVFKLQVDGTWEDRPDDGEAVWGFIGDEYATKTLKEEFFDPVVARLRASITKGES